MDNQNSWDWKVPTNEQGISAKPDKVAEASGEKEVANIHVPGMVSIIIPIYNKQYYLWHFTGNLIGNIRQYTKDIPYEIILVDNGSPLQIGKPEDYNIDKYARNEKNMGVAAAWNQGIRVSSGDYICCINSDVLVFDHWLEGLLDGLKTVDLVMATPMYGIPFARAVEASKKWDEATVGPDKPGLSDFKDFSCWIAKKSLFDEIGMFDEQFFAYCEDIDFCNRLDRAGKKYGSTKLTNTFHAVGSTQLNVDGIQKIMDESKEKLSVKKYEDAVIEKPSDQTPVWGVDVQSVEPKVTEFTMDNLPSLVRTTETGDKAFFVKEKCAHWVTNPDVLKALGFNFGDIINLKRDLFYQLDGGEDITMENVKTYVAAKS